MNHVGTASWHSLWIPADGMVQLQLTTSLSTLEELSVINVCVLSLNHTPDAPSTAADFHAADFHQWKYRQYTSQTFKNSSENCMAEIEAD